MLLIDPVLDYYMLYPQLIEQLDLKLVMAVDTHTHADHVTVLGHLRDTTGCITVMGEATKAERVSCTVREGEILDIGGVKLKALFTPGRTNDSFSFVMEDRVLAGDVLLIRGTGCTDFQSGDPLASHDSTLPSCLNFPIMRSSIAPTTIWTVSAVQEEWDIIYACRSFSG